MKMLMAIKTTFVDHVKLTVKYVQTAQLVLNVLMVNTYKELIVKQVVTLDIGEIHLYLNA